MGKTMTGGVTHEGNVSMLTPEQQRFLRSIGLGDLGKQAGGVYSQMLQGFDPQQSQEIFKQSIVDPAMMQYNQQILPSIQQRFVDANAGSSSALNQALAQSATDMTVGLGSQYGQFMQNQQGNALNALAGLSGLAGQQTFTPLISQQEGILGPLLQAGGNVAASAAMMSSRETKENIKDYNKIGLDEINNLSVKQYDYKEKYGGSKDRIGLIAEEIPSDLTIDVDGISHVDIYALVSVMINSIKDLTKKVEKLEAV